MTLLEHEIPTVYIVGEFSPGTEDIPVSIVYEDVSDIKDDVAVAYYMKSSSEYHIDVNNEVVIFPTSLHIDDSYVDTFINNTTTNVVDVNINIITSDIRANLISIGNSLFLYSFLLDNTVNTKTHYRLNLGNVSKNNDVYVEVELASVKYFNTLVDIYCTTSGTLYSLDSDIRHQNGRLCKLQSDVFSVVSEYSYLLSDLFVTTSGTNYLISDIQQALGSCVKLGTDIYNCTEQSKYIGTDFKTRSIFIDDFFLGVDNFTTASGVGYVDIIDYIYKIDEATIFILKDGIFLDGLLIQDITNGKRVFFDPIDDYHSDGEIIITVYAESVYGESLEEDFYLLYGYNLELLEKGIFWDAASKVYVKVSASNSVACPNMEGVSYYFNTAEYPSLNLGATINAIKYKDLRCSIYPQSTAFYYGRTYTVTVSGVKDFHGNELPSFTYTFTIESP